jgi:hypothetical protein
MKMGTTASPWRYDAGAFHTLQLIILRMPAILRSAQIVEKLSNVVRVVMRVSVYGARRGRKAMTFLRCRTRTQTRRNAFSSVKQQRRT